VAATTVVVGSVTLVVVIGGAVVVTVVVGVVAAEAVALMSRLLCRRSRSKLQAIPPHLRRTERRRPPKTPRRHGLFSDRGSASAPSSRQLRSAESVARSGLDSC
jgi:hypothetical protein